MSARRLARRHTTAELARMLQALRDDPANRNHDPRDINLYTPAARRRMAEIGWAIHYRMQEGEA